MLRRAVRRLDLGTFVRPASETGTGAPRVEPVHAYLVPLASGLLLFDTGLGEADPDTEAHYRPRRTSLQRALASVDADLDDVALVVNCHLHFDHIGANPLLRRRPILVQARELEDAGQEGYTVPELVEAPGLRYERLDGPADVAPGVRIVPTPGHTAGHQSLLVECDDGLLVLAGQAHDTASHWSSDVLAARAPALGHEEPLPAPSSWMAGILALDPQEVRFAHDAAVWRP